MESDYSPAASPASSFSLRGGRRSPRPGMLDFSELPKLPYHSKKPVSTNTLVIKGLNNNSILSHEPTYTTFLNLLRTISPKFIHHKWSRDDLLVLIFPTITSADSVKETLRTLSSTQKTQQQTHPHAGTCKYPLSDITVEYGGAAPYKEEDQHLPVPKFEKQHLLSPPPSPPHDWVSREEDPPNKLPHAEDLAFVVPEPELPSSPISPEADTFAPRKRGSTIVYHPKHHSQSADIDLPMIAVENMTDEPVELTEEPEDMGEEDAGDVIIELDAVIRELERTAEEVGKGEPTEESGDSADEDMDAPKLTISGPQADKLREKLLLVIDPPRETGPGKIVKTQRPPVELMEH
ncbi:hypothetical protein M501DRAFT_1015805 [Patellaria atrata CBS 101060]|uniref:Calcipressin n=1 Tax=Patellaria atrata CBS 101060 TaxID=1346257 RepID=A0A9P4VNG8_9PEZI|nr:hypothetical protein M501DRAFT_1015805 [Patellaria atrata CBS 101060]